MDIRQLEAFVYTVKYQSFSLAAQKLYISQPTVAPTSAVWRRNFTPAFKAHHQIALPDSAGTKLYSYATEILTLQQKAIVELANETTAASDRRITFRPFIFCGNFKRLSRSSS